MRYNKLTMFISCALLLSVCTTVTPAHKDNGPRTGSCIQGGPDGMARWFYDYHIRHRGNDITTLRPYLSDKPVALLSDASRDSSHCELLSSDSFSSRTILPDSARIASASTIPNRDACNIPLYMDLKQGNRGWQDEVLMIQEGQCWAIDDMRYLGGNVRATAGTFRQSIESR